MFCSYTHPFFKRHINPTDINCIFEIGSRDGWDAIHLHNHYQAQVYAFECNPIALEVMQELLETEPDITVIPYGAWDSNGEIKFYPVVATQEQGHAIEPNTGASSFFKARDDYRQRYTQELITVAVVRLDDYCAKQSIPPCDLLCMDVQGAALRVLKGMGDQLDHVHYIISELERKPIYLEQDMFAEVDDFLQVHGFEQVVELVRDDWFSDFLYRRKG